MPEPVEVLQVPRAVRDDGTVPFLAPQPGVDPVGDFDLVTKQWAIIHLGGGGGGGAPANADYLVKTAHGDLSAERVVTDTATITWDWSTAGQAKANTLPHTHPYSDIEDMEKARLLGNPTLTDPGPVVPIPLDQTLFFYSDSDLARAEIDGDVLIPAASNVSTIRDGVVTYSKLASSPYDQGSFTLTTGTFRIFGDTHTISGSNEVKVEGTATLLVIG